MARPTLIDLLPDRERTLAANMYLRNEQWETIFKYISIDDSPTAQQSIKSLAEDLEKPMSEGLYLAHMDLANTEYIMKVASAKAEEGSTRHMSEYQKLANHRIRLVNQIDDLNEKEAERGNNWEPSFDLDSPEFKVFKAAVTAFLTEERPANDDFETLNPEERARFFQLLAEGS